MNTRKEGNAISEIDDEETKISLDIPKEFLKVKPLGDK